MIAALFLTDRIHAPYLRNKCFFSKKNQIHFFIPSKLERIHEKYLKIYLKIFQVKFLEFLLFVSNHAGEKNAVRKQKC